MCPSQKKAEVRVFVDGIHLKVIDDLIDLGYGTTRSEVVRTMIHDWIRDNIERMPQLQKLGEKAVKEGYIPKARKS